MKWSAWLTIAGMKTNIIISIAVGLIVIAGLVSLAAIRLKHKKSDKIDNISTTTGQSNTMDQTQSSASPTNLPSNGAPSQVSLPTPEQFTQYDQYSSASKGVLIDSVIGTGTTAEAGSLFQLAIRAG